MSESTWLELDQEWNSIHCMQNDPGDILSIMIDGNYHMSRVLEAKGKKVRVTKLNPDDE